MTYTPAEMMTVAAARALGNSDVCFVGIGLPSAACNLARLTHAPRIHLDLRIRHARHAARRPAALHRRRRTVRDGADHGRRARSIPLLAAGRPHHRRIPGRRPGGPLRQPEQHGHRRLREAQSAPAGQRRRHRDRHRLRADLHRHAAGHPHFRQPVGFPDHPRSRPHRTRAARTGHPYEGPNAAGDRSVHHAARTRRPTK